MLHKRYSFDGKEEIKLNAFQRSMVKQVNRKIASGRFTYKKVHCPVCGPSEQKLLAEKDRFGMKYVLNICTSCGLTINNPQMTDKTMEKYYNDEYSKIYRKEKEATINYFKNQYIRAKEVFQHVEVMSGKKVKGLHILEVGTGAGGILQYFKEQGNTVEGFDLGEEYIDFGKTKGLDLAAGTIETYKAKKKPDVIIMSHVLEHLPNPVKALKQLQKKFMKKDTVLYIEVPGLKNIHRNHRNNLLTYLQNAHTFNFTLQTLRNVAAKAKLAYVKGDETVAALFSQGLPEEIKSDYKSTIAYLQEKERIHNNPLHPLHLKYKLREAGIIFLTKTGLLDGVRKAYYNVKFK